MDGETPHRRFCRGLLLVAAVLLLTFAASVGVAATDRPGSVVWTAETSGDVRSSPTFVNGTVFVGSDDDRLYAIDAGTGRVTWTVETGGDVFSSPSVTEETVYVGSNDGRVYAVNAASGRELWNYSTNDAIHSSPTVVAGTVYVGSLDNTLYGLDAATGELRYRDTMAGGESFGAVSASPTVYGETIYIGSRGGEPYDTAPGTIWATDMEMARDIWSFPFSSRTGVKSGAILYNDTVLVGANSGVLFGLDAATGEQRWRYDTQRSFASVPTAFDHTVYGHSGGRVFALNASTGNLTWTEKIGGQRALSPSSPTVAGDTVYVGSDRGRLYAFDAATGQERWNVSLGDGIASSPTMVNGTVYVGSDDGKIYAVATQHDASSRGSRVRLGTLGHHDSFAEQGPTLAADDPAREETNVEDEGPDGNRGAAEDNTSTNGSSTGAGRELPGFTATVAVLVVLGTLIGAGMRRI